MKPVSCFLAQESRNTRQSTLSLVNQHNTHSSLKMSATEMDVKDSKEKDVQTGLEELAKDDPDAARLAEMGYSQDLKRKFSVWSLIAVSFSLTNSWFGVSAAMITGINSGGPVLLVYGLIITGIMSVAVAISLSELASAYPNSGGQY